MHELSIALSVLDLAAEESRQRGDARIAAIHLKLGPLSGVLKNALLSAFDLAREHSPFPSSTPLIEDVPVAVFCPTCQSEKPVVSLQEMRCITCGTLSPDIRHGRE